MRLTSSLTIWVLAVHNVKPRRFTRRGSTKGDATGVHRPHHHFNDTLSEAARERVTYLETAGPIQRLLAVRLSAREPDRCSGIFLVGPTLLAYILDGLQRPKWRWIVSERSALLSSIDP